MNKVLFVLFKKADLTHEQCLAEWNGERHSSIVRKVPGLKKWVQNHVTAMPNETAPDGIGELWFDNSETMEKAMNSPEMAAAMKMQKDFLIWKKHTPWLLMRRSFLSEELLL